MKKILIIEDNEDVRENAAEILELEGFKALTAENGREGIKKVKYFNPDLIICDIMMPTMDGYEVLEYLSNHSETAGIPFIFLSAKAEKADMRKGMNLGADDYLTKPFDADDLLDAVMSRLKKNDFLRKEFSKNLSGVQAFLEAAAEQLDPQSLSREYSLKEIKKNQDIYMEGRPANYLYFIKRGTVKTYRTTESGKEFVTGMYNSGHFIGQLSILSEKESYIETGTALEDTEVFGIPKRDFIKLLYDNKTVSEKFIKIISNNLLEVQDQLVNMAFTPVRQRAARALLELADKGILNTDKKGGVGIPREDFAGIIGTATETAVRALSQFRAEGLITTGYHKRIVLIDKDKLKRIADCNLAV